MTPLIEPLHPAALLADLRGRAFGLDAPPRPRRIGAEIELIPVQSVTRVPVLIEAAGAPCSLALLWEMAARHGWTEERSPKGPRFLVPEAGAISFEPGGQIEFSSLPFTSATELIRVLEGVVRPLRSAAAEHGIELLGMGIDPVNPVGVVPLQLHGERYLRQAEFYRTVGPAGGRMMRQTASLQINLDWEAEPLLRWRVLNAAAPYFLAIFANSPLYTGKPSGHQSFRAQCWRELDPSRTGIFGGSDDPVAEYLAFALGARAMLWPMPDRGYLPFGALLERGATPADWQLHLTTLFPEVRPRGFVELRTIDALDLRWYAAPIALVAGLTYHAPSLRAAADLLGDSDAALLRRAGEVGLADAAIASIARDLWGIALTGCEALGESFIDGAALEVAREFVAQYTSQGRSPADDLLLPAVRT